MKMDLMAGLTGCAALAAILPACQSSSEAPRPNVILVMADDMGYGDVGFTGNTVVRTPCLDALSAEGVRLDRFYAGAPLSSPTRASVLTGRNPFRTGVYSANVGILRPEEIALPELLGDAGYRTGHFGKWHLGTLTYTETDANRGRPGNTALYNPPSEHGYDVAFVTESKVPTYDPMLRPADCDGRFWDYMPDHYDAVQYGTAYWDIDGNKVTEGLEGDDSKVIMDRVIPFIYDSVKEGEPFFAVVWFHAPHLPCVAGPEYADMYRDLPLKDRNYYGCISALDAQVGRLVEELKRLGIYDNTLLAFCSDNGPELQTPGSAGPFKGKKRSLHEGGLRVPSFVLWPGGLPSGTRNDVCCSTCDYLPTILDILDISYPDNRELDGQSILPLLKGKRFTRTSPLAFCSARQGAYIKGRYKLYFEKGVYELYDLQEDPFEKEDVSTSHPDILEKMKKALFEELASFKGSFEGNEYGRESYDRLGQEWWDVTSIKE